MVLQRANRKVVHKFGCALMEISLNRPYGATRCVHKEVKGTIVHDTVKMFLRKQLWLAQRQISTGLCWKSKLNTYVHVYDVLPSGLVSIDEGPASLTSVTGFSPTVMYVQKLSMVANGRLRYI